MGSEPPSAPAMTLLVEAMGDSESDSAAVDHGCWPVDADDGDAESCCGAEEGGGGAGTADSAEVLSWERWMRVCAGYQHQLVIGDGKCAASATEDVAGGDTESDKLFWEACITHGF